MNSDNKFLVCLYSDPNFLAVNILENLLASNCFVNVVTDDIKGWKEQTGNITTKNKFFIADVKTFQKDIVYTYTIFCGGFINKESAGNSLDKFVKTFGVNNTKTLILLPQEVYGLININSTGLSENLGVIYLGDLLGPRIDLESNSRISKYIAQIVTNHSLLMPVGETLYPIFVSDAARQIVKWLFAFGPYGKEICLVGREVSTSAFWQSVVRILGEIKYKSDSLAVSGKYPQHIENIRINKDTGFLLNETFRWISQHPPKHKISVAKNRTPVTLPVVKIKTPKNSKLIIKIITAILLLPLLTTTLSGGLMFISYKIFKMGNDQASTGSFYVSGAISNIGYVESRFLKYIPVLGQVYKETEYANFLEAKASKVAIKAIPLAKISGELLGNVLQNSPGSVSDVLDGADAKVGSIYVDIGSIKEQTEESKAKGSLGAGFVANKIDLEKYKDIASQLTVIIKELPGILGEGGSKTYLILFENNMELRPTGGFIGSYGLLTFDEGRLSDFTVSDVYSADGQLNGHVEPPAAIKNYLNEANWWLRDSNWDPDFPTSAKRAEWFLDKEIDRRVDGVIATDLYPIKDFLGISGSIYLSDFNLDISASNLYEKVQSEVQDNFFPGTYKKASFLTALSRSILNELGGLSSSKKVSLVKILYNNLNNRHVQIFLHNTAFQDSINFLGWDGAVSQPNCEENCYSDLVGIVEANVGVNKSNFFINRSVDVKVNIDAETINRTLTLTLSNSANTNLGVSGTYKSFVRLLVPEDATDINVSGLFGQNLKTLTPEVIDSKGRKEVGVMVEVLGGETKKIVYSWSSKIDRNINLYSLYIRKQAGVDEYPVSINILPSKIITASSPVVSLTNQGNYLYNTTLGSDRLVKITF